DADGGRSRRRDSVADDERQAIRPKIIEGRSVGEVRRSSAEFSVPWAADDSERQRISISVLSTQQNCQGGILKRLGRFGSGDRRIVNRRHRDGDRGRR